MARNNPYEIHTNITEEARLKRGDPSVEIEKAAQSLNETGKRQIPYDKDLHNAMTMAEEFDRNRAGKDGYVVKEGWDLHELIHSLVVLWRALKGEISHGNAQVVPRTQEKKSPAPLDSDK